MAHDVCILMHRRTTRREAPRWVITFMAQVWAEHGLRTTILFGPDTFVPARIIVLHVDLSVVPDEYLEFVSQYPAAVNGTLKDIRKSVLSTHRVTPGDGYTGRVIVKSDLNCAGHREQMLARRGVRIEPDLVPPPFPIRGQYDYRVFDSPEEVPPEYYEHPALVVEQFRPELEDDLHFTRSFHFFGNVWTSVRLGSPNPIVAGPSQTVIQEVEPHPKILEFREEVGIQYGKIDYTVHGDEIVVFDVNKTTGAGAVSSPAVLALRRQRALGLFDLIPGGRQS